MITVVLTSRGHQASTLVPEGPRCPCTACHGQIQPTQPRLAQQKGALCALCGLLQGLLEAK